MGGAGKRKQREAEKVASKPKKPAAATLKTDGDGCAAVPAASAAPSASERSAPSTAEVDAFVEGLYTVEMNEADRAACSSRVFTAVVSDDGDADATTALAQSDCYAMADCALPEPVDSIDGRVLEPGLKEAWDAVYPGTLTPAQQDLYRGMRDYRDVLFACRTPENAEALRAVTVLHTMNHAIVYAAYSRFWVRYGVVEGSYMFADLLPPVSLRRSRRRMIKYNTEHQPARDQGFTRPTVLIITPFRHTAKSFIDTMLRLVPPAHRGEVASRGRYEEEYGAADAATLDGYPADHRELFVGNTDDCFRIGVSFLRKAVKLYAPFYKADMIVASPLGLKLITGDEGDKDRDTDFLSSIEVVLLDAAHVLLMQNWEHVAAIFKSLNGLPTQSRDTDFSRVRDLFLNGWGKYYRQTIAVTAYPFAELNAVVHRHCFNRRGRIKVLRQYDGAVTELPLTVRQMFHRVPVDNSAATATATDPDARFAFFTQRFLRQFLGSSGSASHVLVFVPSYFDFVRLRNWMKREDMSVVFCSEYTEPPKLQRNRTLFADGRRELMLYSERLHFFQRLRLRGVRHVLFYAPPHDPRFYVEMLAALDPVDASCAVLFSRMDALELERVVGTQRAQKMLQGDRPTYLVC